MPKDTSIQTPSGSSQASSPVRSLGAARPVLRKPTAEDGAAIWDLVRACPPLDENSMYCNLLQADHFRDTSVIAELSNEVVGWVSGYIPPTEPDTFFVWQVAVHERARGFGLGKRMLDELVSRPEGRRTTKLKTTITRDNAASWALFRGFAERHGAAFDDAPHFEREAHFAGAHATEHMVTIDFRAAVRKAA